jgi:WhiB family redox-sensing transcriptional regulator
VTALDLVPTFERPEWQAEALCNTGDAVLVATMFPRWAPRSNRNAGARTLAAIERAKRICGRCPVVEQCLHHALSMWPDPDGIWGGTDERERMAIRRERELPLKNAPRPIEHDTSGGYVAHLRRGEEACADCKWANAQRQLHTRPSRSGVS